MAFSQNSLPGTKLKVEVVSNLVVMPGYVNQSPRLNVVLDTGSSTNVVDERLRPELKTASNSSVQAAGIGKGKDETLHLFEGTELSWGPDKNLALKNQQVATLPIDYISKQTGYPVDAIFGSSLFQQFRIRVDYAAGEATFSSASSSDRDRATVPINIYGGVPFVSASLETASGVKVTGLFMIDSGTTGAMVLSRTFLDAHPELMVGHAYVDVPSATAVGGAIDLQVVRISGLDFGPIRLASPVAAVPRNAAGALANPQVAGFIGAGILSRFTCDWDYQHKTLGLIPNSHVDAPFEGDASGMRLIAEGPDWKSIQVAALTANGPAAQAGFKVGDILKEIDGKPVPRLYEVMEMFKHPGQTHKLVVLRAGKSIPLTLPLKRLV